ncbi:hypothetical protein P171DRAFT_526129, partial [Karstenula rhodostoma CBS 690.94]
MSQQSNTKEVWLRLTNKALKQERRQALQIGRDSVAAGDHLVETPQESNQMQISSHSLDEARGAARTPGAKPEAPTMRPTSSHASDPADANLLGKMCHAPIVELNTSSKRSKDPQTFQHELDAPSAEGHVDNDGKGTCPLLYFYEILYKLRELDALPKIERMD